MPFFSRKKSIVRATCPPAPVGGSSASTISADMDAAGSHALTISGYSGTKGLGVGKVISSVAFTAGGHSWKIRYFPDGRDQKHADWISIYLELVDSPIPNGEVRAQLKCGLLDQAGKPWFTTKTSVTTTFSKDHLIWGYSEFITRKNLESSPHLLNDSFCISCHVTVIKIRAETTPVQFIADAAPSHDLSRDLGGLLESKVGGDVKFKVGKEMFTAHRYVLAARSPVFEAELFGHMREKKAAQIRIDDIEPKVFKAMLHFIYTDSLPEMDTGEERLMAQHLLVAADRYDLKRLKLICEGTLCNFIDTSTLATTLALAEQHDCLRLKERCFRFLKAPGNMKAVMETDGYEHMKRSCPSLLDELLQKCSSTETRDCGKLMTKNLLPDRKESSFAFLTPGFLLRRSNKNVQALGSPSPGSHVPPAQ